MIKIKEHSNRRIMEWFDWFGLEGTFKIILSNSLAMGRDIISLIRLFKATVPA